MLAGTGAEDEDSHGVNPTYVPRDRYLVCMDAAKSAPAVRRKIPRLQRGWLVVYWIALVITAALLLQAVLNFEVHTFTSLVAILLATVSIAIGVIFATRIARSGVGDVGFVKGTTTTRVIAVAWLLVQAGIFSGAIVAVIADVDTTVVDWTKGFLGTVGSLSILAILGPGYSEYRGALPADESAD